MGKSNKPSEMKVNNVNDYCLLIDGGTTNTRFTLMDGEQVLERTQRRIGATDADQELNNHGLRQVVASEIKSIEKKVGSPIARICCSGMIASGNGLVEVPHIPAPAGLAELAGNIQGVHLPEVSIQVVIDCIPGVKCEGDPSTRPDMMRGEETEIMGLLRPEDAEKRLLVIHFGSHNKIVEVNRQAISASATTLSGELLYAITQDTILRSAVCDLEDLVMDESYVRMGFEASQREGMSRALFATRLNQVLDSASPRQGLSFLFGILTQQDEMAFSVFFTGKVDELVLYGRDPFAEAFLICMKEKLRGVPVRRIGFEESEWLSVRGMQRILARREQNDAQVS